MKSFYVVNKNTHQVMYYDTRHEAMVAQRNLANSEVHIMTSEVVRDEQNEVYKQITVAPGEHALLYGKVQSGKRRAKMEFARTVINDYELPVILLFRSNNLDYVQFAGSIPEMNKEWREKKVKGLPTYIDLRQRAGELADLLHTPNLLLGLADPDTVGIINDCLEKNPDLSGRAVLILDEADLVTFELNKDVWTKTEAGVSGLADRLFMIVSVTATPLSIVLCNRVTQVHALEEPADYYGIERITHIPVNPVLSKRAPRKGQSRYRPELDRVNLDRFFADVRKMERATALLTVTKLTREHKDIVQFFSKRHPDSTGSVLYMECNETSVKVYNGLGELFDVVSTKTPKGGKVADIAAALDKYIDVPHIFVIAGVHAGRGVSFVSRKDRSRHLTHQYLAASDTSSMVSLEQSIRLCGRYPEADVQLYLYCSQVVFDELRDSGRDLDRYTSEMRAMPQGQRVVRFESLRARWDHSNLPERQIKGVPARLVEDQRDYDLEVTPYRSREEAARAGYSCVTIKFNVETNIAEPMSRGIWTGGRDKKERFIWCDPLRDIPTDHPFYDDIQKLYELHPEYEGRCVRKSPRTSPVQNAVWEFREPTSCCV